MSRPLLILGCGGHGRVVADAAALCGYDAIAFLDDAPATGHGLPVLGPLSILGRLGADWPAAIAAVGDNRRRADLFAAIAELGLEAPSIVHPSAIVSPGARLGAGVFVGAGVVVNVGARIGDAAILNTGARIDHDCIVGPASHIAPGATLSGGVVVGARAWLGTGCAVRQGVVIGADVVVGVGAAVISDLATANTYVGVPARVLGERDGTD
jgi:sugar O-acyltransferase (sialic acid O-acetyltransferase NeuD family)